MKKPPGRSRAVRRPEGTVCSIDRVSRRRGGGRPGTQYLRTSGAGIGEAAGAGEYSGTMNRIQPSVE